MAKQYYNAKNYEARKSVGYLARRARTLMTSRIEALFAERFADKDITFVQYVVLMCLRDDLARTSAEICQYVCYDSGALTRVIDQMEKRRWLKRKRSTTDRRVIELSLTALGRKTVESLIVVAVEFYNEMLADFTHAEADTLISLMTKLVTKLDPKSDNRERLN
jgi:DNA-binding MarR family transcriptional regulator